ncbi:MAG TPA: molybdopterin molybdotransferase MoeA [Anaerolineaceae bacterium]|nr:molybdopterin molybdotransferase MoeA [Anaerolineaceae bacterium]
MLSVIPLADALSLVLERFGSKTGRVEYVSLQEALDRYLGADVIAQEDVPAFDRSTVDGFAVRSADLHGCSDSIPAILQKTGESLMGHSYDIPITPGTCVYVPTGGAVPPDADAMVMLEYTEDLGGDQFAFYKPVAPGANLILRGEDLRQGEAILKSGKKIGVADIGTLAALGKTEVPVFSQPVVGIISTGDELVAPGESLKPGQIRDVNSDMLRAAVEQQNGIPISKGIVEDKFDALKDACKGLIPEVDVLLVSGGTSVGEKDNMPRIVAELGEILVHGLAVKPGKPTIIGQIEGKAVFGLPGNPVAAFFIFDYLVKPLLLGLQGGKVETEQTEARLTRAVSSNHGREEFVLVRLEGTEAEPVPSKSGLISTVSRANAYFIIPRDQEGLPKGALVRVTRL